MFECTKIEPPIEIRAARDNVLRGTAQSILLARGTDDVYNSAWFKEEYILHSDRSSKRR